MGMLWDGAHKGSNTPRFARTVAVRMMVVVRMASRFALINIILHAESTPIIMMMVWYNRSHQHDEAYCK